MKKIIVDLDDVLAMHGYLNMMNAFLKKDYKYEETNSYYVEEIMEEEQLKDYKEFFKENNVYDYASPEENSQQILMELMLENEIYICSSYYSDIDKTIMPELIPKKCEFLSRNYPFLTRKNFIFTNDKNMIDADIRIGDRIENLQGNGIKLLYNAYHNRNVPQEQLDALDIKRVNNWLEIKDVIKENYKIK